MQRRSADFTTTYADSFAAWAALLADMNFADSNVSGCLRAAFMGSASRWGLRARSRRGRLGAAVFAALVPLACGGHVRDKIAAGLPTVPAVAPATPAPPLASPNPAQSAPRACAVVELPPARVWRLTHVQLRNTLRDVFGFVGAAADGLPADARLEGYANGADRLGVSPLLLDNYRKVADEVATEVVRRSQALLPCPVGNLGQAACRGDFVRALGLRAFRRPLGASEEARFDEVYHRSARAGGPELGLKMLVEAMILSPAFLFRFELGGDPRPGAASHLDPYEMASALSYTLWDSPPDAELLALARSGDLADRRTFARQAERLLGDRKRSAGTLATFFQQWLKIEHLLTLGKDAARFPQYTPQLAKDLLEENRRTVEAVLFEGDGTLTTLLTGQDSHINNKLGALYGVKVRGGDFKPTRLDATERRGILTQAAFLAARADADTTRPVDRGAFVREEILCAEVPPPPDEFKFDPSQITDDMTAREKLSLHARSAFCARCHALFDGIGFALERYDAIGQFRVTDKSRPIDPSGTLPMPDDAPITFVDFVDLVDQLATRQRPFACFAERALAYTTGRAPDEISSCEKQTIAAKFAAAGYRVDRLILDIVTDPAFVTRRTPPFSPPHVAKHGQDR